MIYIHLVFSTKNRYPFLKDEGIRKELYSYIAKILYKYESTPIEVGGYVDHVHIFFNLSKNICLKDVISVIKKNTSKWLKTKGDGFANFHWQAGYGGFSVGEAQKDNTVNYIRTQERHHKKMSFQEELILFMEKNNMEYDERYLWD